MYGLESYVMEGDIDLTFDLYFPLPEKKRSDVIYALHGISENKYKLRNFASYFVNKNYFVVVPTLRSHTDSITKGKRGYLNLEHIIKDMTRIQRFTDELFQEKDVRIDNRILAGNSLGGNIALQLASKTNFKKNGLLCFDCLGDIKSVTLFHSLMSAKDSVLGNLLPFAKNINLPIYNLMIHFNDLAKFAESIDEFCITPRDITAKKLKAPLFSIHGLEDYLIPQNGWELFCEQAYKNPDTVCISKKDAFKGYRFMYVSHQTHSNTIIDESLYDIINQNINEMLADYSSDKERINKKQMI